MGWVELAIARSTSRSGGEVAVVQMPAQAILDRELRQHTRVLRSQIEKMHACLSLSEALPFQPGDFCSDRDAAADAADFEVERFVSKLLGKFLRQFDPQARRGEVKDLAQRTAQRLLSDAALVPPILPRLLRLHAIIAGVVPHRLEVSVVRAGRFSGHPEN